MTPPFNRGLVMRPSDSWASPIGAISVANGGYVPRAEFTSETATVECGICHEPVRGWYGFLRTHADGHHNDDDA